MNPDATLVFEGTVRRLNDSTLASVQPDRLMAVVRVDRVLRVPEALNGIVGSEITVRLARPIAAGATTVFSTIGWLYGESLAVSELDREPAVPLAGVTAEQQLAAAWTSATSERLASAAHIVLGDVQGLQPHPQARPRRSEHDPDWWLADVRVEQVLKGKRTRTVGVTFSNSSDALWVYAPKLLPSQKSILVLHRNGEGVPGRASRAVLRPHDLHAPDKLDFVMALL